MDKTKKGILFESQVAEKLKSRGFAHVQITKASRDYGADILAFKDGLEYVFQCKKYQGTVGFGAVKDVATAIDIYQGDKGILVCDTSFSKAAKVAVSKIEKPIELITLEEILNWKSASLLPTHYKPFPYQCKILNSLKSARNKGKESALLVLATGLGKTLIAAWDLQNQLKKGQKALFLVHRKDILVDNAAKFNSVLNDNGNKFKLGIYFGGKKFSREKDIVFATYQTLIKYRKQVPPDYFDYIIVDEAHHSPAATYASLLAYFKPKFILGITATPKRITRQDNEFIESVFGKPLVDLDLAEALIKGYVTPVKYSVFCDNVDYEKLKSEKRKLSIEQLNKSYFIPTKDEDIESIIQRELAQIHTPKTIIFCPNIKYINSVKSIGLFQDAEVYHSGMDDFQRQLIFRRFKTGKIRKLLVVDLFNEGIDIPEANLVVFLRTTYSPTIFFQQLGRGLRKAKGKKCLRVLDFVGAISNIRKVINVFGHLLLIQDFVEKVEKQKKLSNVYKGLQARGSELLDPLDLDFYQAGKRVNHKETAFKRKSFLEEINFLKKRLIKWEGWTEEEIINELKPLCIKLGHFPSKQYLASIGKHDIARQIDRGGGVYYFANKLGYLTSQKEIGFFDNWDNFKGSIVPICKKLRKMPTKTYLENNGYNYLSNAIQKKWGGMFTVANRLGYEIDRQPPGFWTIDHIQKALLPICKKNSPFPTTKYLKMVGRGDLARAINRTGAYKVAAVVGFGILQKPKNYWTKWQNFKKEIALICNKLGHMPNYIYLRKNNLSGLQKAIYLWGGLHKVSEKLGYSLSPHSNQSKYHCWDSLEKELRPICKKFGQMPSGYWLKKNHFSYLLHPISKHGGINVVAKRLGYASTERPKGYWNDWDNLENELLPICKQLGKMPTCQYLSEKKLSGAVSAINKFGGASKVAEKLGFSISEKPKGYWSKWKNVEYELVPLVKRFKRMPTNREFLTEGKSSLCQAVYKIWGGRKKVEMRLSRKAAIS